MSDFKSKLPSFNEITSMAGKLFKDVKKSVCEIMDDYKKNHPKDPEESEEKQQDNVVSSSKSSATSPMKEPKESVRPTKNAKPKMSDSPDIQSNPPENKPNVEKDNQVDKEKPLKDDVL